MKLAGLRFSRPGIDGGQHTRNFLLDCDKRVLFTLSVEYQFLHPDRAIAPSAFHTGIPLLKRSSMIIDYLEHAFFYLPTAMARAVRQDWFGKIFEKLAKVPGIGKPFFGRLRECCT